MLKLCDRAENKTVFGLGCPTKVNYVIIVVFKMSRAVVEHLERTRSRY